MKGKLMETLFACEVEGLSTIYVSASDEEDARNKLEAKLIKLSDPPHGGILSIKEVTHEGVKEDD